MVLDLADGNLHSEINRRVKKNDFFGNEDF